MRGTIAKKLRQRARLVARNLPSQLMISRHTKQIIWTGFRRIYKDLKKEYKECQKKPFL